MQDTLAQLSDALVERTAVAQGFVVGIRGTQFQPRSGTLWRADVAVASEQVAPKTEEAEIVLADGRVAQARVAGRDRGTNVVAFRLQQPVESRSPSCSRAAPQAFVLVFGADGAAGRSCGWASFALLARLGIAWVVAGSITVYRSTCRSRAEEGDRFSMLREAFWGCPTAEPSRPRVGDPRCDHRTRSTPLLTAGRVERGWLGLALHPVALPEAIMAEGGQGRGLMVMRVSRDGPAGKAGVLAGDILVSVGGAPTGHPGDVARQLGPESVGQTIELRLIRSRSVLTLAAMVTAHLAR